MKKSAVAIAVLAMLLALLTLSGCGTRLDVTTEPDPGSAQTEPGTSGESDTSSQFAPELSDTSQARGTVKQFEYGDFSVEVTNVKEVKRGTAIEDENTFWEYDIYVVYPGATATIKSADTFVDEETSLPHASYAFLVSGDSRIDILDNMGPMEITQDVQGIYSTESSLFVLGFEVYSDSGD